MLIEFRLKNYASFKNEAVLSAQTGERLYKYKDTNTFQGKDVSLLKNLLIFGPNGAGKSRLLRGLHLMKYLIINGGAKAVTDELHYAPFWFNKNNQQCKNLDFKKKKINSFFWKIFNILMKILFKNPKNKRKL